MATSLEWWALTFEWAGLLPIFALFITIDAFVPVSSFIAGRLGVKNHPERILLAIVFLILLFFIDLWSAFGVEPRGAPLLKGDLVNYTIPIGTDETSESIGELDATAEVPRPELQLEEGQGDTEISIATFGSVLVQLHVLFYYFLSIPAVAVMAIRNHRPLVIWVPLALLGTIGAVVWLARKESELSQAATALEERQTGRKRTAPHVSHGVNATGRLLIVVFSVATILVCLITTVEAMQEIDLYDGYIYFLHVILFGGIGLVAAAAILNMTLLIWAKPAHTVVRVGFHIVNCLAMDVLFVLGFNSLIGEEVVPALTLLIPGMVIAAGYRALFDQKQLHGEGWQPIP